MTPERETFGTERSFDWSPSGGDPSATGEVDSLPVVRVRKWTAVAGLRHGFFGRRGGTSGGPFRSLNLSTAVPDDTAAVQANWTAVHGALAGLGIVRMRQVHGARVVRVRTADDRIGEADGMVSDASGVALSILTADCVPLLFVSMTRRLAAAVHAGWRGTEAGIATVALQTAEREWGVGPGEWQVAMGPAIGGCCYEVEAEIGERLESRWGRIPEAWSRTGRKGQLDLREANRAILAASGVRPDLIFTIGPCTACAHTDFYSHRRSAGRTGRQLSYLGWSAN